MAKQLSFLVSFHKVKYALLDVNSKDVLEQGEFALKERTESENKDELKKWLGEKNLLNFSEEVTLSFIGKNSTLVPQNIIGETTNAAIYELSFGKTMNDLDYNRFPEMGLVNIYEIPSWVKSFFVVRYPSIIMQHEGTHLLRGIFKGTTFKPLVHLSIDEEVFFLVVTDQNKLEFFNSFDFKNMDDIIYHTLFVLDQKGLNPKELKISWSENHEKSALYDDFKLALEKIKPEISMSYKAFESFKNQSFCV